MDDVGVDDVRSPRRKGPSRHSWASYVGRQVSSPRWSATVQRESSNAHAEAACVSERRFYRTCVNAIDKRRSKHETPPTTDLVVSGGGRFNVKLANSNDYCKLVYVVVGDNSNVRLRGRVLVCRQGE